MQIWDHFYLIEGPKYSTYNIIYSTKYSETCDDTRDNIGYYRPVW